MTSVHKQALLTEAKNVSMSYRGAQSDVSHYRDEFVKAVEKCHKAGLTQLEIANETNFSRQRIAQFMKESK